MQQREEVVNRGEATLREVVARCPASLPVFHAFGMDACCGGSLPLREAAARHGVALDVLLAALRAAEAPETGEEVRTG